MLILCFNLYKVKLGFPYFIQIDNRKVLLMSGLVIEKYIGNGKLSRRSIVVLHLVFKHALMHTIENIPGAVQVSYDWSRGDP